MKDNAYARAFIERLSDPGKRREIAEALTPGDAFGPERIVVKRKATGGGSFPPVANTACGPYGEDRTANRPYPEAEGRTSHES